MSKPNIYGTQRAYTPNSRADSRRRKLWEHNRQIAERDPRARFRWKMLDDPPKFVAYEGEQIGFRV